MGNTAQLPPGHGGNKQVGAHTVLWGKEASFSPSSEFRAFAVNKKKTISLLRIKLASPFLFFYPHIHIAAASPGNMFAGSEKFLGLVRKCHGLVLRKGPRP